MSATKRDRQRVTRERGCARENDEAKIKNKSHLDSFLFILYSICAMFTFLFALSKTFKQDRHVKRSGGDVEPVVDPSQDYVLMLGYENATHTVMRFKRKLETCDTSYDIAITVSRLCHSSDPFIHFVIKITLDIFIFYSSVFRFHLVCMNGKCV